MVAEGALVTTVAGVVAVVVAFVLRVMTTVLWWSRMILKMPWALTVVVVVNVTGVVAVVADLMVVDKI